ncbi:MAG TPA: SLBB domain-containing protein [Fimbriimonas sp.]|nr:SLBB domain-containing protein [Fimbriimonas sp.]
MSGASALAQQAAPSDHQPVQASTNAYVLGPDDQIAVTVLNHQELCGEATVTVDGFVTLPAIGQQPATGHTLQELTDIVSKALKTNPKVGLLNPVVSISLKQARMQRIYVLGEVRTPGVIDMKPGWRITEALAAAGGIGTVGQATPSGLQVQTSDCVVALMHSNSKGNVEEIPLDDVLSGAPDKDLRLAPGDTVTVRVIEMLTVYIAGNVVKPGPYQLRRDASDVMKAITVAGGFTPLASTAHVSIQHLNGGQEVVDVSGSIVGTGVSPSVPLRTGDLITVPELQSKVTVLGLVKQPGTYPMQDGKEVRLNDVITGMGQGADTKRARLSKVTVIKLVDGKASPTIFDFGKYLRTGDLAMNPVIHSGEVVVVPETNTPEFQSILQGIAALPAIFLAGFRP